MSYCSASTVVLYCSKNLLGPDRIFTESTSPTFVQVEGWLEEGYNIINTALAGHKYSVPVASTACPVYDWLVGLNAKYAAAWAEQSRMNTTLGPDERSRGQAIYELFWKELDRLLNGVSGKGSDLTLVGLTRTSIGQMYAGGISRSDKQLRETDSDRVTPFAFRGFGRFPGTIDPAATTAS